MLYYLTMLTLPSSSFLFFFFNDTATTEIYTLSLHALFRSVCAETFARHLAPLVDRVLARQRERAGMDATAPRSEEHTSELQSPCNLVCRLLLEKKNPARSAARLRPRHGVDRRPHQRRHHSP